MSHYGYFQEIHRLNFRVLPSDLIVESGDNEFVYLARSQNIYKLYFQQEKVRQCEESHRWVKNEPHLAHFAHLMSRARKHIQLDDFRVMEHG